VDVTGGPPARHGFVQWEFPGRLGPEPGRYAVRRYAGDAVRHVLVVEALGAPRRAAGRWVLLGGPRRARARTQRAAPGAVAAVEVTRATVIDAHPLGDLAAADAWLERAAGRDSERVVGEALELLNRAVAGHRVAAADPFLADADPARALVCRIGYGTGDRVADGGWEAAREVSEPRPQRRRAAALGPQDRLAALLGGRDVTLACEELALRARGDLAHGRAREAALQASVALDTALAELAGWRETGDLARRLDELSGHREPVAAAARAALEGGLDADAVAAVDAALGRLEAALRARALVARA
jgi:hypothetical protein